MFQFQEPNTAHTDNRSNDHAQSEKDAKIGFGNLVMKHVLIGARSIHRYMDIVKRFITIHFDKSCANPFGE